MIPEYVAVIDEICDYFCINKYTINRDGSIDVNGDVDLSNKELFRMPIKFNKVNGIFNCSNNHLTSLLGSPIEVGATFSCSDNELSSLEHCPKVIASDFFCSNNMLTSLEHCPSEVDYFYCHGNRLTSLDFCPSIVLSDFIVRQNNLPHHITLLLNALNRSETSIFLKYHNVLGIWSDGYDQEAAQDLFDDIKDGLL